MLVHDGEADFIQGGGGSPIGAMECGCGGQRLNSTPRILVQAEAGQWMENYKRKPQG